MPPIFLYDQAVSYMWHVLEITYYLWFTFRIYHYIWVSWIHVLSGEVIRQECIFGSTFGTQLYLCIFSCVSLLTPSAHDTFNPVISCSVQGDQLSLNNIYHHRKILILCNVYLNQNIIAWTSSGIASDCMYPFTIRNNKTPLSITLKPYQPMKYLCIKPQQKCC